LGFQKGFDINPVNGGGGDRGKGGYIKRFFEGYIVAKWSISSEPIPVFVALRESFYSSMDGMYANPSQGSPQYNICQLPIYTPAWREQCESLGGGKHEFK